MLKWLNLINKIKMLILLFKLSKFHYRQDLDLPLFVIMKIIFLMLFFRWCEPVEPWTCSRRFLRTPDAVMHLPHRLKLWSLSTSY
jgi:hypothetical protein